MSCRSLDCSKVSFGKTVMDLIPHSLSPNSPCCHTASWGRGFAVAANCKISCSVWCVWTQGSSARHALPGQLHTRRLIAEKLWRELLADPSQWWDNRSEKLNPRYPDFKHKNREQSLWLDNNSTPPWVVAELAAMAPGTLQSDCFSWNVRLRRHLRSRNYKKTIEVFWQMQGEGMDPDSFTFLSVLSACSSLRSLEEGRRVHRQIIERGYECEVSIGSCLVDMYVKCRSINDARRLFNKMPTRPVTAWNAIIRGYVKCGKGQKAIQLSRQMEQEGTMPDPMTFVALLNACASVAALEEGRRVHEQIIERGYEGNAYVCNSLVDMYAKCGIIEDARKSFDKTPIRNVVAWNALVLGYVKCGEGHKALELYRRMQGEGVDPNPVTFMAVLNACASVGALEEGRCVDEQIAEKGYESNVFVGSSLIDMYSKCGSIVEARRVFNKMRTRDVVAWSAMIMGYVKCGEGQTALELFRQMQLEGVDPNAVTFVAVLNACATLGGLEEGRRVHEQVIERGYQFDVFIGSGLVDMYAKCGSIGEARRVFDNMPTRNVVAWSAMILGYVKCGEGQTALELYGQMQQEGLDANAVTFLAVLKACANVAALEEGRRVHEQIMEKSRECDVFVDSGLVDMYAKCGSIDDARRVFDNMSKRDVVAWSAMILGYAKSGEGQMALELYGKMQQDGVEPNSVTFVAVLNACAEVAALEEGRRVHRQIIERGQEFDVFINSGLVDMYAKCGSMEDARRVFDKTPTSNIVAWNAMLAGYCRHGLIQEALEHFERMCQVVEVNATSFVSLLSACSHGGLVAEGMHYFESMTVVFNVSPTLEHYACVIDLLGRAGDLHEAEDLITRMPCKPDTTVWMSLLGACRLHGNVEMGERVSKRVLELDPGNAACYVLLSNIYASETECKRNKG